jgi:hypothetical protein
VNLLLAGSVLLLLAGCSTSIKVVQADTGAPLAGVRVTGYERHLNVFLGFDVTHPTGSAVTDSSGIVTFHGNKGTSWFSVEGAKQDLGWHDWQWVVWDENDSCRPAIRDGDAYVLPVKIRDQPSTLP